MQLASNWGEKTLEVRAAIQRNFGMLEEGTDFMKFMNFMNFIKFNRDKCRVLHLGRKTPSAHAVWEPNGLETALLKRTWMPWWTGGGKVHMSQQCATALNKAKSTRAVFAGTEPGE